MVCRHRETGRTGVPRFHHRPRRPIDGGRPAVPVHFLQHAKPPLIEDNMPFTGTNPWRLPDQFEITDALATVRQHGRHGRAHVRHFGACAPTIRPARRATCSARANSTKRPSATLDLVPANRQRAGHPAHHSAGRQLAWKGGRAEYAGFRGKSKDDFWTDPQLIADFKQTIRFVLDPHQHAHRRALLR